MQNTKWHENEKKSSKRTRQEATTTIKTVQNASLRQQKRHFWYAQSHQKIIYNFISILIKRYDLWLYELNCINLHQHMLLVCGYFLWLPQFFRFCFDLLPFVSCFVVWQIWNKYIFSWLFNEYCIWWLKCGVEVRLLEFMAFDFQFFLKHSSGIEIANKNRWLDSSVRSKIP